MVSGAFPGDAREAFRESHGSQALPTWLRVHPFHSRSLPALPMPHVPSAPKRRQREEPVGRGSASLPHATQNRVLLPWRFGGLGKEGAAGRLARCARV